MKKGMLSTDVGVNAVKATVTHTNTDVAVVHRQSSTMARKTEEMLVLVD